MSHFVRASKYRHVFVESPKANEVYSSIRQSTAVGEQNYLKANAKFFAVAVSVSFPNDDP
jgi:coronin-1B/1C/6